MCNGWSRRDTSDFPHRSHTGSKKLVQQLIKKVAKKYHNFFEVLEGKSPMSGCHKGVYEIERERGCFLTARRRGNSLSLSLSLSLSCRLPRGRPKPALSFTASRPFPLGGRDFIQLPRQKPQLYGHSLTNESGQLGPAPGRFELSKGMLK